jgi:hypothetical protein
MFRNAFFISSKNTVLDIVKRNRAHRVGNHR